MAVSPNPTSGVTGFIRNVDTPRVTPGGNKSAVRNYPVLDDQIVYTDENGLSKQVHVKQLIRDYIKHDLEEKNAKEQRDALAESLRAYGMEIRDSNALEGDYQKSYRLTVDPDKGLEKAVTMSQVDKFKAPDVKEHDALKALVGDEFFNDILEQEDTVSIKKSILDNASKRAELNRKLKAVFSKDEIKEYFELERVWIVKKGTDKKQYELGDKDKINKFRGIVVPSADSVKDTTESSK